MTARILPFAAVAAVVVICFVSMGQGSLGLLYAGLGLPYVFLAIGHPNLLLLGGILLWWSMLKIPGVPLALNLAQLSIAAFAGTTIVRVAISQHGFRLTASKVCTLLFLAVLFLTIAIRGFGVRAMGGSEEGGARYIHIILTIGLFLLSDWAELTPRQWKFAVVGMVCLAVVPAAAHLLYVLTRGAVYQQFAFVGYTHALRITAMTQESEAGTQWAVLTSLDKLVLIPFLLWPFRAPYRKYYVLMILAGLFVSALSGYRTGFLGVVLLLFFYFFWRSRNKIAYVLGVMVLTALAAFVLGRLAFLFPYGIQRVLSIIPGANISHDAWYSAQGTVEWRLMLWREGIRRLPQYLWIGQGFSYDAYQGSMLEAMRGYRTQYEQIMWAIAQADYHQGVISTLITVGLFGTIFLFGALFFGVLQHARLLKARWTDPVLGRYHLMFFTLLCRDIAIYILAGQAHVHVPLLFFNLAMLAGLARHREQPEEETASRAETVRADAAPARSRLLPGPA